MSSISLNNSIMIALKQLSERLKPIDGRWLVGGSCALILHGVELHSQPRDLDIYIDEPAMPHIASLLKDIASDEPHYSETAIYRSTLSHYQIAGVHIECVGGFEVDSEGSLYRVEVDDLLVHHSVACEVDGTHVKLMALAHELVFNVLRKRVDRYEAIAQAMRKHIASHETVLCEIVQRNELSADHLHTLSELLGFSLQQVGG